MNLDFVKLSFGRALQPRQSAAEQARAGGAVLGGVHGYPGSQRLWGFPVWRLESLAKSGCCLGAGGWMTGSERSAVIQFKTGMEV